MMENKKYKNVLIEETTHHLLKVFSAQKKLTLSESIKVLLLKKEGGSQPK